MSNSLQTLEPEVVCQITEALMLTNGATTTLEVKMELREQGFFALQAEVSAYMTVLAEERNWKCWSNGRYRVYTFAEDTDENLYHYMSNGRESWEILVAGNLQMTAQGSLPADYQEFPSNRHALAHASGLILIQESKGFTAAVPQGIRLPHRHHFREWIKQTPRACVLSFRNGISETVHTARFHLHGQTAAGWLVVRNKVGYAFEMDRDLARQSLSRRADVADWEAPQAVTAQGMKLGEEWLSESAFLASGEALGKWTLERLDPEARRSSLRFPISGIYKAELIYPNGRTLALSYRDWLPETELWPLVLLLLGQSAVNSQQSAVGVQS